MLEVPSLFATASSLTLAGQTEAALRPDPLTLGFFFESFLSVEIFKHMGIARGKRHDHLVPLRAGSAHPRHCVLLLPFDSDPVSQVGPSPLQMRKLRPELLAITQLVELLPDDSGEEFPRFVKGEVYSH